MDVKIIENWAEVTGEITGINKSLQFDDFDEINIRISDIKSYENYPNLLDKQPGGIITVTLRNTVVKELNLKLKDILKALVRVAPKKKYFARQDKIEILN